MHTFLKFAIVVVGGLIFSTPFILFGTLPLFFIGLVCTGLLAAASYAASFQSEPPPKANLWDRLTELWKEYPEGIVIYSLEFYDKMDFFATHFVFINEYTSISEEVELNHFVHMECENRKVVVFWKSPKSDKR